MLNCWCTVYRVKESANQLNPLKMGLLKALATSTLCWVTRATILLCHSKKKTCDEYQWNDIVWATAADTVDVSPARKGRDDGRPAGRHAQKTLSIQVKNKKDCDNCVSLEKKTSSQQKKAAKAIGTISGGDDRLFFSWFFPSSLVQMCESSKSRLSRE